ncbi:MAG TPA: hypothetical protein VFF39_18905, partial [Verrucomicrobiae bacterium]|nr:hypothetical protein [Verrucomicrobiae bacterium]
MTSEIENSLKTLARRWRGALRQCLIVSFQSHKGGQGRTLSCAHLAVEALLSAQRDESKPVKLLMMDCDWSAPGLSYLIGALPEKFKKQKTPKFSTNKVLGSLIDALGEWPVEEVKRLALCQGAPVAEDIPYWCGIVEKTIGVAASDLVGEIRLTTELSGGGTSDSGSRIYFLDADLIKSVADVSQQFLFQSRLSEAPELQKRLHSADQLRSVAALLQKDPFFAWLTRLLVLYLVRGIGLDYVFLDCQAGTSIHSWFLSTLIADVVLLPTSGLEQSQHGTRALAQWLQHARDQIEFGTNVSYGPLAVEIFASNIPVANLSGIGDDSIEKHIGDAPIEKYIDLAPKIKREYENKLGFPLATFLPYVEALASRERMAYDLKPDELRGPRASVRDLYIAGIRTLLLKCEELARQKRGAEHLLFTAASEEARRGAEILRGKPPIRIAVEAGEFGEKPFKDLLKTTVAEGVTIEVEGIDHMVIYRSALAANSPWLATHDIVAFPHYLLGYLAAKEKILPLHSLDVNPTSLLFETKWLDNFLLSNETCFANGALYAFPFSVMRKLLLYRGHSDAGTIPRDWNEFMTQLNNKCGSIALENDFK